jgi:putative ABC transport system permease protein
MIRFHGDAAAVSAQVRDVIRQTDPNAAATPVTLRALLDDTADRFSVLVRMVGVLAGLALALSVLGIYGVVAFAVSRRTKELGIRIALGATPALIVRLVLTSGARPVIYGLGIGLPPAVAAGQAIAVVLRNAPVAIRATDPYAFTLMPVLLALAAIAAMLRSALRAATADPAKALREQ